MSDSPVRPGSDEEWAALLRQLQLRPKARPRPFFYARLHARLAARAAPRKSGLPSWVRRPAYAVLLGMLGLAVSGDGVALPPAAAATQQQGLQLRPPAALLPR